MTSITTYLHDKIPQLLILDLFNIQEEINTRIQMILGLSTFGTSPKEYNEVVENSRGLVDLVNRYLSGRQNK